MSLESLTTVIVNDQICISTKYFGSMSIDAKIAAILDGQIG